MLRQENFAEEHIRELQKNSKRDPVLLMDHPRRLSTDIDIIVEPGTNLDDYLEQAAEIFPFKTAEEQKRVGKNNIEKRHRVGE